MHIELGNCKTIKVRIISGTLEIELANPPVNALSKEVREGIKMALDFAETKHSVESIRIQGGKGDFFSGGADIKNELLPLIEIRDHGERRGAGYLFSKKGQALMRRIMDFPKPITAFIDGYAFGGGLELALACHTIIATERSIIGLPEVTLGLIPCWGGTFTLLNRCRDKKSGRKYAIRMIHEGFAVSAQDAKDAGIIDRTFPSSSSMPKLTIPLFTKRSACAQAHLETYIFFTVALGQKLAFEREAETFGFVFSKDDAREGILAFIEKREPRFQPCV